MDNITYERGIFQMNSLISALLDKDNIYQVSGWNSQKNLIGVSINKYNELKKIADGYYDILIEKGIIEKPKTQEELIKEQQQIMNDMLGQMKAMQEEIRDLKDHSTKDNIIENTKYEENHDESYPLFKEEKKNDKKLLNFK